jgi:hypothetical protein
MGCRARLATSQRQGGAATETELEGKGIEVADEMGA